MNNQLLQSDVQDFIRSYEDEVSKLAFSGSPFKNVSTIELIEQIESLRKAKTKLPSWFAKQNIIFPPKRNLEQTSSEITAEYKSSLLKGNTLADITGGFGIDSLYFAKRFEKVTHFELNEALSEMASYNFKQFGITNIRCLAKDGLNAVLSNSYHTIYADPSRRHASKGKVFFLNDCEPNIPSHLDDILAHCDVFLLKTSPMLDISAGLKELKSVAEIHIVAVNNEVKELLWLLKKNHTAPPHIKTINITPDTCITFDFDWQTLAEVNFSAPSAYLYEPNASIMKSGGMDHLAAAYSLHKIHEHTHLFTSNEFISFPGRCFLIEEVVPYSKKNMRKISRFEKANISTRNFLLSVAELRKKWKIRDGGEEYLFFVTLNDNSKAVLVCKKT